MLMPVSVVDLACELIRIPSVNPAGDPGTAHTGEAVIASWIGKFLQQCGAEVEIIEVLPGRPNVIGRFPAAGTGKPVLLFAPHTDTVGVGGMSVSPFSGEIRDGKIHGRGACDTKGPMAAQLWALWQMRDRLADLSHEIWFAGLMDEEAGQLGSTAAAEILKVDFAIIAEPTSMDIVHTHKGSIWLEVETRGIAAHSSRPELGRNAIYAMARLVQVIAEKWAPQLAGMTHSVLGSPTISAGMIQGGAKINVVPDRCVLEVDVRTIPGMEAFLAELERSLKAVEPGVGVRLIKQSPPLFTAPDHPLIGKLEQTGSRCLGAPWFCDAAILSAKGIPAIAMGPGSIEQAHTADEFIEIAALEAGADQFVQFLASLA